MELKIGSMKGGKKIIQNGMYQLTGSTIRNHCTVVFWREVWEPISLIPTELRLVIRQVNCLRRSVKCHLSLSRALHSTPLQCKSVSVRQHSSSLSKPCKLLQSRSLNFFMPKPEATSWISSLRFKLLCEFPAFSCVFLKKWQHSHILHCV